MKECHQSCFWSFLMTQHQLHVISMRYLIQSLFLAEPQLGSFAIFYIHSSRVSAWIFYPIDIHLCRASTLAKFICLAGGSSS